MRVLILGAGAHGRIVLDTLEAMEGLDVVGFLDDDEELSDQRIYGYAVLGRLADLASVVAERHLSQAIVGIGHTDMRARDRAFRFIKEANLTVASATHPLASVSGHAKVGQGVLVGAGSVVGPGAQIGPNTVIYASSSVDHDCALEENVYLSPGVHLAGTVSVGAHTFIGTGAVVIPGVRIGAHVTVGAGAVVIRDIPDRVVAVGVPARVIRQKAINDGT